MGDVRNKYETASPPLPTREQGPHSDEPRPVKVLQGPSGLTADGYGVEVVGYEHKIRKEGEALVEVPRNSIYKLRFSNANDHLAMVKIELDGVCIGSLLLSAYSFCDLERPIDRPLTFTFCLEEPTSPSPPARKGNQARKKKTEEPPFKPRTKRQFDHTCILCTFQPETGSRTLEFDVRAHHIEKCQRLEMPLECTASELFREMVHEFGEWVASPRCALVHWTTAEYDSPVEEVITSDMQMTLRLHPSFYRNCIRKEERLRKMAFILMEKLQVIDGHGNEIVVDLTEIPTFGHIIENVQQDFAVGGEQGSEDKPIFFLSDVKRFLGSTKWIRKPAFLFELLQKDEILRSLPTVKVFATTNKPKGLFTVYVRVLSGRMYELEASGNTTIRELRCQLAARNGPWGEDPRWLFGGALLENGRTLAFYGVRARDTVDIVLRMSEHGARPLDRRDPVAVEVPEGENPISSVELLPKKPEPTAKQKTTQRELPRGGTRLKGRTSQQFIEVDPVSVDDRFFTKLLLALVPDDEEFLDLGDLADSEKGERESCEVM